MIDVGAFEDEISLLKNTYEDGYYEYINQSENFTDCTKSHFKNVVSQNRYGVYIVRQRDTQDILYIGKSGTIDSNGKYKKQIQDIPIRLTNVRGTNNSNVWFRNLLNDKGPLKIEYIFLPESKSPSFVEKLLLQAYLNEYRQLPYENKEL